MQSDRDWNFASQGVGLHKDWVGLVHNIVVSIMQVKVSLPMSDCAYCTVVVTAAAGQ